MTDSEVSDSAARRRIMKKSIKERDKSEPANQSKSSDHSVAGSHRHDRFPTAEELDALFGDEIRTAINAELLIRAYQLHLLRVGRPRIATHETAWSRSGMAFGPLPVGLVTADLISALGLLPRPSRQDLDFIVAHEALRHPRVNHRMLKPKERDRLNNALQKAHQAGTYQPLAEIHSRMALHRMHSMHGPVGTQRFLPWHRLYLLKCEELLKAHEPLARIPYWDFANDHERPDWVWQPPNVTRGTPGANAGWLPTQQMVESITQNNVTYTGFTSALEANAHNEVHNWCNGTITSPETAALDPVFWLLHANVDRIWNQWQAVNDGVPSLNGINAVLDPWGPTTAVDVDSIIDLGYWYSGVAFVLGPFSGVRRL
jgi:tyrosinase